MIKKLTYFVFILIIGSFLGCNNDDDSVRERPREEVYPEDLAAITEYLQTHFYNYEEYAANPAGMDFDIQFGLIEGANADKTPLIDQVTTTTLRRDDIDYQVFTLKVREGGDGSADYIRPSFADSVLVSYHGYLLDGTTFDNSVASVWLDLPTSVPGFMEGITQFTEGTEFVQNPDGTLDFENSGIGAVFFPSGLGYYSTGAATVPAYSPLIFTFQSRRVKITDHDGDGIFSKYEDLNGDRNLQTPEDNTDEDFNNFYNYIDRDDDNDTIPTKDENADPNGDGNPDDALDSDNDGIPDYLDDDTTPS